LYTKMLVCDDWPDYHNTSILLFVSMWLSEYNTLWPGSFTYPTCGGCNI